jgi:PAS domain S-box-containing protein
MANPLRVLIVEDRPADAELMAYELRRAAIEFSWRRVETEDDYLAALKARASDPQGGPPDLILSDGFLPFFDSTRALELWRQNQLDCPFIIVSGEIGEELAVDSMKRGAADYLYKDRLGRLGQAALHALETARLRVEQRRTEAALRARLELLVEERTSALERANERLQAQSEAMGTQSRHLRDYNDELTHLNRQLHAEQAERERLLAENHRQEEFLARLLESAPLGIAVVRGPEHRYEYVNPAYQAIITGRPDTPMLGRPWVDIFTETGQDELTILEAVYHSGQTQLLHGYETAFGPGRERTFWDISSVPLLDDAGQVNGVLIITNEVTEAVLARRQVEDALRRAEDARQEAVTLAAQREAILGSLNEGLAIAAPDGTVTNMNAAALRLHGMKSLEEARCSLADYASLFEVSYPDGQAMPVEEWPMTRALHGETFTDQQLLLRPRKAGNTWIGSYGGAPVYDADGRLLCAIVTLRDITAQKTLEREREALLTRVQEQAAALQTANQHLRQQTDDMAVQSVNERTAELSRREADLLKANQALRYQAFLMHNVRDIISAVDNEGRITAWNYAAETLLGIPRAEAIGQSFTELVPSQLVDTPPAEATATLEREGHFESEVWLCRRDGSRLIAQLQCVRLIDEQGLPVGVLSVYNDLTARKQAEESLLAANEALRRQSERLQMLHELDRAILEATAPAEIAHLAAAYLRRAIPCHSAIISILDLESETLRVLAVDSAADTQIAAGTVIPAGLSRVYGASLRSNRVYVEDISQLADAFPVELILLEEGACAYFVIPLLAAGRPIGAVIIWRDVPGRPADEHEQIVVQVADSLAVALQNARLFTQVENSRSQLQALSRRLVEVQENERRAIARELHDEVGQALTAVHLGLHFLETERDPDCLTARIGELKSTVDGVMENLHRLAVDLRPISLDRAGLVPAIEQYIESFGRQSGLQVDFVAFSLEPFTGAPLQTGDVAGPPAGVASHLPTPPYGDCGRLDPEVETAIYRVVQEALTNVARHARAGRVSVILERRRATHSPDEAIVAVIEDDGAGFDVDEALARGRLGLLGMRERVEMLGGSLTIESAPGAGATVVAEVPCG